MTDKRSPDDVRHFRLLRGGKAKHQRMRQRDMLRQIAYAKMPQMRHDEVQSFSDGVRDWLRELQYYLPKDAPDLAASRARNLFGEFVFAAVCAGSAIEPILQVAEAFEDAVRKHEPQDALPRIDEANDDRTGPGTDDSDD